MKRIANILDREGSFVILRDGNSLVPRIRLCSNNHIDLKYIAEKTNTPFKVTKAGQTTLTIWQNTLMEILPQIIPLMKNSLRLRKINLLLKAAVLNMGGINEDTREKYFKEVFDKYEEIKIEEIRQK